MAYRLAELGCGRMQGFERSAQAGVPVPLNTSRACDLRKTGDCEGDREADDEHVDRKLAEERAGGKFALWGAGQRDCDEGHEQMNQGAVENST